MSEQMIKVEEFEYDDSLEVIGDATGDDDIPEELVVLNARGVPATREGMSDDEAVGKPPSALEYDQDGNVVKVLSKAEDSSESRSSSEVSVEETAPVAATPSRPKVKVEFSGSFGKAKAAYTDVYQQSGLVMLVSDMSSEFLYEPPASDDVFSLRVGAGRAFDVVSPGVAFDMPNQGVSVLVLALANV